MKIHKGFSTPQIGRENKTNLKVMGTKKIIERISLTVFVFSLLAGIYIIGNAWFHPETLTWQLTHYASWPREDNFGVFSFIVSFFSFLIWNLTRE